MPKKYIVLVNSIPVPIVREETITKIDSGQATIGDIKNEIEYVVNNINKVLAMEGTLEAIMTFIQIWDLRDYIANLANIANIIKKGSSGSTEVTVSLKDRRITLAESINLKLNELGDPEAKNTSQGIIYVYKMNIAVAGRVGSE